MRVLMAVAVAATLAGCVTASQVLQGYMGRPIQDAVVDYGPPANVFDMGDGRRAFQWSMTRSYQMPTTTQTNVNVYAPPGGAFINGTATSRTTGGQVVESTCLYTAFASWDASRNAWIVVGFQKPRWTCE